MNAAAAQQEATDETECPNPETHRCVWRMRIKEQQTKQYTVKDAFAGSPIWFDFGLKEDGQIYTHV